MYSWDKFLIKNVGFIISICLLIWYFNRLVLKSFLVGLKILNSANCKINLCGLSRTFMWAVD